MKLSEMAQNLEPSVVREMFDLAAGMEDTIRFTVGEPDFVTPGAIIDEACRWWQKGETHYTPNKGIPELLQAIAEYHREDLAPDPDRNIIVTCGATEALQLALFTLVDPGDEVIVVTPIWPNYLGQIRMAGAMPVCVIAREENGFLPDPEDIRAAITPRTKLIMLNSPANPTGAVMDRDTCRALVRILQERDIYVISDEIYGKLVYEGPGASVTEYPGMAEKIVYISGFSKMFAMTGWRLGYAVAPPDIISSMAKIHEYGASNLPAPSQYGAAYALRHCLPEVEEMRRSYLRRRDLICGLINQVPGMSVRPPKGAFYAFANVRKLTQALGMNSKEFCMDLLKKTGVVIVPGSGFGSGGEGYVRITYAASDEDIRRGMERIRTYVESSGVL